ncbi:MAG: glycosyltransferase family 87 protein, partial [Candidatus Omnitrophota bacterium]
MINFTIKQYRQFAEKQAQNGYSLMTKIILVLLIVFFICFGIYTTWRTHNNSTDFDTYYFAAKDICTGQPIYSEHEGISPYIYPPFFACLLAPFAIFNMETASLIWYVLNIVFAFSILLCFKLIFDSWDISVIKNSIPLIPKLLFLIIVSALIIDNISMLQVNVFLFFLVVLGLYFFRKGSDVLAALFLAMAISIKIIPVLFLLYFIVKREFRICIFIILWTFFFSLAIPTFFMGLDHAWASLIAWNDNMLAKSISLKPNFDMMSYMFNPQNQSVKAFFSKWLMENDFSILCTKRVSHEYYPFMINWTLSIKKEYALYAYRVFTLLLSIVTFFYCRKKIKDRKNPLLNNEFSLIFLLSIIVNPVLKTQQMVFIIFPLVLLLSSIVISNRHYRFFYRAMICFSFLYL